MPDLDLIKQAEQGCMRFGTASPAISGEPFNDLLAGRPEDVVEQLKAVEKRYPGLDRVICATPLDVQVENLDRFAKGADFDVP